MKSAGPLLAWPGWKHLVFSTWVTLLGVIWFCLIYGGADAFTAHRHTRVRIHFDAELDIPFVPEAVVVYMSVYLLFLAAPFIVRHQREFLALALTLDILIFVSGIGFLLVPAQLAFAPPSNLGAFPELFRFADRLNLTYNLVPSLHVALSACCVSVFVRHASRIGRMFLLLWAAAIALSTLLMHQHHVLDVVTGLLLALAAFRWVFDPLHKHAR